VNGNVNDIPTGRGPQLSEGVQKRQTFQWLNSMVYGRYNMTYHDITIVNGGCFMVCTPTNITGWPHPVVTSLWHWTDGNCLDDP
jgi:hypothetical protein